MTKRDFIFTCIGIALGMVLFVLLFGNYEQLKNTAFVLFQITLAVIGTMVLLGVSGVLSPSKKKGG